MKTESFDTNLSIIEESTDGLIILAYTPGTIPTDAGKFAPGAIVITNSELYYNSGTSASPSWNSVSDISSAEIADGAVTNAKLGTDVIQVTPAITAQEEVVLTGAISVALFLTTMDTTAAATGYTLAAGTEYGQLKKIVLRVDGGNATITGAFTGTNNTLTFADAGDFALLQWDGTDWIAIELGNYLDMTKLPVLSEV